MLLKEQVSCRMLLRMVDNAVLDRISAIEEFTFVGSSGCRMPFPNYEFACAELKRDLEYLLVISDDEPAVVREQLEETFSRYGDGMRGLVQKIYEGALESALIKRDFSSALSKVGGGEDLSWILGFSLSSRDLSELAKLHRDNKFRDKIEGLLTDCNLHEECANFISGRWHEYI